MLDPRTATPPAPQTTLPGTRRGEEGSAYLVVLMLLVVLTVIGLSLSVITQTEVIIGGSEKQATRQLFAAGSGVQLAAVYELVASDSAQHKMSLAERSENFFGATTTIGDRICSTPFIQLAAGTCNLCMMNQDAGYSAVQYGVTATALRHGDDKLAARRTIGSVLALEPWEKSSLGYQEGSDERLKDDDDIGHTIVDETDPCEGLVLKI
jgi:Tfp pilus assembly protein PilX